MAFLGLVVLWFGLLCVGVRVFGGGQPVRFPLLCGLLLGRWLPGEDEPCLGELLLVLVGRIGSVLFLLALIKLVWDGRWLDLIGATGGLLIGLVILIALARGQSPLAGLADVRVILHLPDGYLIFSGRVEPGGPLCGASLADLDLRRHGLLVLAIERSHGDYVSFPKGQETLVQKDLLIIYGRPQSLCDQ